VIFLIIQYFDVSTKIVSRNIQWFGPSREKKITDYAQKHANVFNKIQADIICIQEVMKKGEITAEQIIKKMNGCWRYKISEKLEKSRERYAFMYNSEVCKLIESRLTPLKDNFSHPPFIGKFQHIASKFVFNVVSIHTKPLNKNGGELTKEEIANLLKVSEEIKKTSNSNIIIMGDLNWDFMTLRNKEELRNKFANSNFVTSLAVNKKSTMVKSKKQHDKIFLSAGFNNQNMYIQTDVVETKDSTLSDHEPIYVSFTSMYPSRTLILSLILNYLSSCF